MKVSYGNQDLTICKRSFDLIYFQCDNKDKLIVDNQQFNITPGFKKTIYKNSKYQIISDDLSTKRIYEKKIHFNNKSK